MMIDRLETEQRNIDTDKLDLLPTHELLALINREDELVASAVRNALPEITTAVDLIVDSIRMGGRLFYFGAGTSGRLGVLDAAECPPTFSTPADLVQGLIAGGEAAMFQAVEGAEDNPHLAELDFQSRNLSSRDIVVGLAASGRTPYVLGGLRYAAGIGCPTIAVVCVSDSALSHIAGLTIAVKVGPEVISGSTRMKAGTAQKMVLNMLSTATMVKLNKTYGNLMVDVKASNVKLNARICRIVREATGVSEEMALDALALASGSAKVAIVMLLTGIPSQRALHCVEVAHGSVRQALLIAKREIVNNESSNSHNG